MTRCQLPNELLLEIYDNLDIDSRLKFEKAMNWKPIRRKVKCNSKQLKCPPVLICDTIIPELQESYYFQLFINSSKWYTVIFSREVLYEFHNPKVEMYLSWRVSIVNKIAEEQFNPKKEFYETFEKMKT